MKVEPFRFEHRNLWKSNFQICDVDCTFRKKTPPRKPRRSKYRWVEITNHDQRNTGNFRFNLHFARFSYCTASSSFARQGPIASPSQLWLPETRHNLPHESPTNVYNFSLSSGSPVCRGYNRPSCATKCIRFLPHMRSPKGGIGAGEALLFNSTRLTMTVDLHLSLNRTILFFYCYCISIHRQQSLPHLHPTPLR